MKKNYFWSRVDNNLLKKGPSQERVKFLLDYSKALKILEVSGGNKIDLILN